MTGSEPKLRIGFNPYLEPNYLDKNVLDIYYNAYLHNLKTFSKYYKCFFISARDIECNVSSERWDGDTDPFLKNRSGAEGVDEEFMSDLLVNGTYWHISARKTENGYKIEDGKHRLLAIKTLMERGPWAEERKVLAATNERIVGSPSPSNQVFFVPIAVNGEVKKRARVVYSNLRPTDNAPPVIRDNFVLKSISEPIIHIPSSAHLHVLVISGLLRDAFYEYRLKTNSVYPPHKAINDEKAWTEWKPENFTDLLRVF